MRPTADAGFDMLVRPGAQVELDGTASTEDVTYTWTLAQRPASSNALLAEPTRDRPQLQTDAAGAYMVALVVTRNGEPSLPDVVLVQATNAAPTATADCAGSCSVVHGRNAQLDGGASNDPDGDALTYRWTQLTSNAECQTQCSAETDCNVLGTAVALSTLGGSATSFTAPQVASGRLVFRLAVSDALGSSDSTCLAYTVTNTAPLAGLAASSATVNPVTVGEGTSFTLSGTSSGDADGDVLTYAWSQVPSSFPAMLTDWSSASSTAVAPTLVASPATLPYVDIVFTLQVDDGVQTSSVQLTVRVVNS